MQPSSGSTGSITAGCCVRSGMSRRRSWKWRTIANSRSQPLRPDSNEMVSGEPGAIQVGRLNRSCRSPVSIACRRMGARMGTQARQEIGGEKNQVKQVVTEAAGGEGGIRTLDELLTHTPLAGERLRPLGHLSGRSQCTCRADLEPTRAYSSSTASVSPSSNSS
jgi:hypothetical protein